MRLLFVSNGFPPRGRWGTEFYTQELVQGLVERGHEVAVLHPVRDGERPRYEVTRAEGEGGVPVFLLHNSGGSKSEFSESYEDSDVDAAFARVLEEFKPDLVHFTYLLWGLSVGMVEVARSFGAARVATLTDYGPICHRGQMFDWQFKRCEGPHPPEVCARCIREPSAYEGSAPFVAVKRLAVRALALGGGLGRVVTAADLERREAAVRKALDGMQRLIAPTRVLAEAYRRFGVDGGRMEELVYSIEERPYLAARPEPARDVVRFGFLGQFTPHKGLHVLLDAVRILSSRLPESVEPWEVLLFGKPAGGRHRRYARLMFEPDPGPRVKLAGSFLPQEGPRVLAGLHALVLPSLWDENAPLSCLQARAAGIPIIGSDVKGIAEVVRVPEDGRLFAAGSAEALADAMREVLLGRLTRHPNPSLPVGHSEHLDRIERLYHEAGTAAAGRGTAGA